MVVYLYSSNTVIVNQISQQGLLPNKGLSKENKEKNHSHPTLWKASQGRIGVFWGVVIEKSLLLVDPIIWKSEETVWESLWPLTEEELQAPQQLLKEHLVSGHIVPSFSIWNSPFFVIEKTIWKVEINSGP